MKQQTAQSLRFCGRNIVVPFSITLPKNDVLICDTLLRVVPGRRVVVAGTWQNKAVVAKMFFHKKKALRDFEREYAGVMALKNKQFLTPALLYTVQANNLAIAIYEKLAPATSLQMLMTDELLNKTAALIAQQHMAGIMQRDIHLDNFLISADKIYTIDGADIRSCKTTRQALKNLALFLVQLPRQKRDPLVNVYFQARQWDNANLEYLNRYQKQAADYRLRKFLEKTLRNCTATAIIKNSRKFIAYDRALTNEAFQNFLRRPEAIFQQPDIEILKDGNTCTVIACHIGDQKYVIKRYNIKNFWHGIGRALRHTRARYSWINAHLLQFLNIPTAKPCALIENYQKGFRREAYFVTEYLAGQKLGDYLAASTNDSHAVLQQVAHYFQEFAEQRVRHGDTKADNFIVINDKVYLIDLDALRRYRYAFTFARVRHKDMARFLKNWQSMPHIAALMQAEMRRLS